MMPEVVKLNNVDDVEKFIDICNTKGFKHHKDQDVAELFDFPCYVECGDGYIVTELDADVITLDEFACEDELKMFAEILSIAKTQIENGEICEYEKDRHINEKEHKISISTIQKILDTAKDDKELSAIKKLLGNI